MTNAANISLDDSESSASKRWSKNGSKYLGLKSDQCHFAGRMLIAEFFQLFDDCRFDALQSRQVSNLKRT